jgi:hypothetical protein
LSEVSVVIVLAHQGVSDVCKVITCTRKQSAERVVVRAEFWNALSEAEMLSSCCRSNQQLNEDAWMPIAWNPHRG